MTMEILPSVQRGAALLDQAMPGWHDRIDTDRLDLRFTDRCVLGQLYGGEYRSFQDGATTLSGVTDMVRRLDWAGEHGFWLLPGEEDDDRVDPELTYQVLTSDWRQVIDERRKAAA